MISAIFFKIQPKKKKKMNMVKCYQLFTGLLIALRQLSEHLGLQSTMK